MVAHPSSDPSPRTKRSGPPGEGHLVEGAGAELFRRASYRAAPQRAVELNRRLVVRQSPDDQAFQTALGEVAARGGKKTAAEAKPLKLRPQVDFVDLALVEQAARAIAPVIGIAGDAVAEPEKGNAAALADGALPPGRPAPADQLLQLGSRDDPSICVAPCFIVGFRHRYRIGGLGAANLDEGR